MTLPKTKKALEEAYLDLTASLVLVCYTYEQYLLNHASLIDVAKAMQEVHDSIPQSLRIKALKTKVVNHKEGGDGEEIDF
tara:strand:- start:779 stop:1018 length:240 start_codon:yes stop_codon:yes gene_type:complete